MNTLWVKRIVLAVMLAGAAAGIIAVIGSDKDAETAAVDQTGQVWTCSMQPAGAAAESGQMPHLLNAADSS